MVAHLKISFMSMRKAGGSSSHTLTKYKRVKHNVHKFPMASILCANKQKLAPRGKFEVSQIERSCVEKEKGFREGCEGGWARRHGMVWAEHPGRRPLAVIPIKLWLVSRQASCTQLHFYLSYFFSFSLPLFGLQLVLPTWQTPWIEERCNKQKPQQIKHAKLKKDTKHRKNCRLGKIHTTTRTNIIAMTMITKKTTTRILASVAVLYGGEGWEGWVLGWVGGSVQCTLCTRETVKRVPRVLLRRPG